MGNRRVFLSRNQQASTKSIKMSPFLFFMFLITTASAQRGGRKTGRAPSRDVNCDCQCSTQGYEDYNGWHGDCRTSDNIGNWCFVHSEHNKCGDIRPHNLGLGNISYEACKTPHRDDPECLKKVNSQFKK